MNNALKSLRKQIAVLQAEQVNIELQPRSRAEVVEAVNKYVEGLVTNARREATLALDRLAAGGIMYSNLTDLPGILSPAVNAKAIIAFLLAGIETIPVGLDKAARIERLAEIESSLYALEVQEEAAIDAIELETGQIVPRRFDARPEIVLDITA